MATEAPQTNTDGNGTATGVPENRHPGKHGWLRLRAKSFSLRWAAVSAVLWLTAWNKGGTLLSGTPLIIAATVSSCAVVGFYVAHRTLNK